MRELDVIAAVALLGVGAFSVFLHIITKLGESQERGLI